MSQMGSPGSNDPFMAIAFICMCENHFAVGGPVSVSRAACIALDRAVGFSLMKTDTM